ncbi:alpha-hydroxy-acid oxidizing protein [Corticibacter populi]|uniref:Alpha-hydroxy-acid oxidizing protein n=1 Tax=Corticibacter populi TaxID=1550736 RepID=A0A3M6QTV8_9BURK|nr:alpha-hydroxy acid oxidase [Corticibacter populi]RMX05912.1 alpha-hydroxy-acid oxidizing protein [Corticibacter populi]RZS30768.1 L-lactate dehydrogenase (cytochrome)/(S)-mandelate dehydrogenase [Corticibacter populi]
MSNPEKRVARLYATEEFRSLARQRLPKGLFEYVDRGAGDERARGWTQASLDRWRFVPRLLCDVSQRSQDVELFGQRYSAPLAISPTAAAGLLWFEGEIALARAARTAGLPFTLSTSSITSMERVAEAAGPGMWFQLYMWPDRRLSYGLVDRVREAGYGALILTVDTPVLPLRPYNLRNGFGVPIRMTPRNVVDVACHPRWALGTLVPHLLRHGMPRYENYPQGAQASLGVKAKSFANPKNDSCTWDDLHALRRYWKGPLLVKGILSPEDARLALQHGADGVVLSNHAGRNLDSLVAPLDVLPQVADSVGHKLTVLVDSGFASGSDAVKALALGAKAVMLGRAPLYGLGAGGEAGAARVLRMFCEDIERTLALVGCRHPGELSRAHLHDAACAAGLNPARSSP